MSSNSASGPGQNRLLLLSVLVGSMLSVLIHLSMGWEWTAIAAIAVGYVVMRRAWLSGSLTVMLGWAWIVVYSFALAPEATMRFSETFAGILGNLPAMATVALTLLIAAMIGLLGGLLGSMLAILRASQARRRHHGVPA